MSFTLTTSAAAVAKAGIHANATIVADTTTMNKWSDEAEGYIVARTRKDWVTDYSGLSDMIKNCLSNVCSSLIAMQVICYDITGYSRAEAQLMLDVQYDLAEKGLNILEDFKVLNIKSPL